MDTESWLVKDPALYALTVANASILEAHLGFGVYLRETMKRFVAAVDKALDQMVHKHDTELDKLSREIAVLKRALKTEKKEQKAVQKQNRGKQ